MAKRREVNLDLTPELSQVVARDFNLFYQPQEKPIDPSIETFVKSLDAFAKGALTKGAIAGEKKEKEVNDAEAKKLWETGKKDFEKAVKDGLIDENSNPYLIDKYRELELNSKARAFKEKLYNQYEELDVSENTNAGAFDKFYKNQLEKFVKENELLNFDAVDLNKGFFTQTDKIYNSLANTHSQTQLSKIGENYKTKFKEKVIGAIEDGNDGDPDTMPKIGDTINKLIKENIHLKSGTKLRDYILEGLEEWIKNTDDFEYAEEVLESLMKYVDGGTNKFENIGVVKNKIDALKQTLMKEKNDFDDEQVKVYNNKVKVGKIEVRKNLAEKMKQDDFNFYEWRKTDEYLNLMHEVQDEAKKYYSSMGGSFASSTDASVLTEIYKRIRQGNVYDEGGADEFLETNKDLFSRADYEKFKTRTIPNAFYTTGDELKDHPIFADFQDMAKIWMRSPTVQFDPVAGFLKFSRWEDDIYAWMGNNSLEKFGGDKQKRADAFKAYVTSQMENFTLGGLEEVYEPPTGEGN